MNEQSTVNHGGGGPLRGITVVEVGGIGPVPFAGMMLADHGAHVIRIERPGASSPDSGAVRRSRTVIACDLKTREGQAAVKALCAEADGLIEGFRPGAMERLGLGPDVMLADNPRLVFGRMTGWGQTGPLSAYAGHDINYIALAGALHAIGRAGEKPVVPLNLIGDYAGGGMMLAFGMLAALIHARATGEGQVVDCAMTEGAALMMAPTYSRHGEGRWSDERGTNLLDGGAPFYDCYETADDRYVALGSIEPPFYRALLRVTGLDDDALFDAPLDRARWPEQKRRLAAIFAGRTQAAWCAVFEHEDLCFAPVLSLADAPRHPHNVAREAFVTVDGLLQPAPAPRYSRTRLAPPRSPRLRDTASAGRGETP